MWSGRRMLSSWHNGMSPPLHGGEHAKENHRSPGRPRACSKGEQDEESCTAAALGWMCTRNLSQPVFELMLSGDEKTGRAILRNYINATVGFRQLEAATSIPANSLMRMFGPNGNPSAKNLFGVLAHLQAQEGVNFELRPRRS
jgi:hypothetical protein